MNRKVRKAALIILSTLFSGCMIGAVACSNEGPASAFFEGAADTITLGDSIDLTDYLEEIDADYTLIIKKGDFSKDISGRAIYTPDEPGEWTLSCTVKEGKYKGTSEFKLTVKPESLVWNFTSQNKIYDIGDTLVFDDYFSSLKIQCDYYYDYSVVMDYVAINGVKTDLTDKTDYKFENPGEYVFKFHLQTTDGVQSSRAQIIKVRYISDQASQWFSDNNAEFFNAVIAEKADDDSSAIKVVLDKGTSSGSSWTNPSSTTIPYIAFSGNYGLNDYAVIEFTGANMPQIAFFCDEITSSLVDNKKGIYVSNGYMSRDGRSDELQDSRLTVYAPYKVSESFFFGATAGSEDPRAYVSGSKTSRHPISNLALNERTKYKLIMGFNAGTVGGTATLVIRLIDLDTEQTLYDEQIDIKAGRGGFTENYFSGSIVLYGSMGKKITFDKVYPIQHTDDINTIDRSAEFNQNAPSSVIIGLDTKVSDFISTDKACELTATHNNTGEVVTIDVSKETFTLDKTGEWTLAYKIKEATESGKLLRKGFKTITVLDGDKDTITWMKANNVTANRLSSDTQGIQADNTFVMSFADMWLSGICSVEGGQPYVALNGNYGAGTFVSLDFVGKAMPYVSFFNKKVTNSLTDSEEGILLVNGVSGMGVGDAGSPVQKTSIDDKYTVMAPKKAESGNFWSGDRIAIGGYDENSVIESSVFGAANLVDGTNYRLIVGITNCQAGTGAEAKFTVNAMLIKVDTNQTIKKLVFACNLANTVTKTIGEDFFSGSIVIYGSTFGETKVKINSITENDDIENYVEQDLTVSDTTKDWIKNNSIRYYNAESIADDKTITLAQNKFLNGNRTNPDAPYIGLNKDIDFVNTAVSIDFTGKNMPFIGFAQGRLTSSWTDGTKGILLTNGFIEHNNIPTDASAANTRYATRLLMFKPNNMQDNGNFWDGGMELNGSDGTRFGIFNFDDSTSYRLVLFIEKNTQYNGYFMYIRLYTLKDGQPYQSVLAGNAKIGSLTDFNDEYFTGKLTFMSSPAYKAQFKINGVFNSATTSELYKIACGTQSDSVINILEV